MKKPGIPTTPNPGDKRDRFDGAIHECLQIIMGRNGNRITALDPNTATLRDCALKINEILDNIQ